jgi:hypothetical protein
MSNPQIDRKRWRNEAGQLHRLDGPAEVDDGYKEWWVDGMFLYNMDSKGNGSLAPKAKEIPYSIKQSIAIEKLKSQ